jgi:hypothetical protein
VTDLEPTHPVAVARPLTRTGTGSWDASARLATRERSRLPSWASGDAARPSVLAIRYASPILALAAAEIAARTPGSLTESVNAFSARAIPATAHHALHGPFAALLGLSVSVNRFNLAATLARNTARNGQERSRARDGPTARPGVRYGPQAARSGQERPARAPPIRARDGPTCRGMVAASGKLTRSMLGAWSQHAASNLPSNSMLLSCRYLAAKWQHAPRLQQARSKIAACFYLAASWPHTSEQACKPHDMPTRQKASSQASQHASSQSRWIVSNSH